MDASPFDITGSLDAVDEAEQARQDEIAEDADLTHKALASEQESAPPSEVEPEPAADTEPPASAVDSGI